MLAGGKAESLGFGIEFEGEDAGVPGDYLFGVEDRCAPGSGLEEGWPWFGGVG